MTAVTFLRRRLRQRGQTLLPLLAAGVLYPLNFVLHPIDSVILMTLFVAWLLSGTA